MSLFIARQMLLHFIPSIASEEKLEVGTISPAERVRYSLVF